MRHAKNGLAAKFTIFIFTRHLASSHPRTAALAPATKSEASPLQALIAPQPYMGLSLSSTNFSAHAFFLSILHLSRSGLQSYGSSSARRR
jgi:hypothetical protein